MTGPFDLSRTNFHLGLGARVVPLPDFEWTKEYLDAYDARFDHDGDEGRLVTFGRQTQSWDMWERHPVGDELVVIVSGHVTLIQELDGAHHAVELRGGQAVVNPAGVWHTADVHEPGDALFVTAGRGTEHRRR